MRNNQFGYIYWSWNTLGSTAGGGGGGGGLAAGSGLEVLSLHEKRKFGRVRLSTNALKINMEDVPSIVAFENLSWSSSVNRLLLLFILAW